MMHNCVYSGRSKGAELDNHKLHPSKRFPSNLAIETHQYFNCGDMDTVMEVVLL